MLYGRPAKAVQVKPDAAAGELEAAEPEQTNEEEDEDTGEEDEADSQ